MAQGAPLEDGLTVYQLLGRRYGRGGLTSRLRAVAEGTGLLGRVVGELTGPEAQALVHAFRTAAAEERRRRLDAALRGMLVRNGTLRSGGLRRPAASRGVARAVWLFSRPQKGGTRRR